MKLANRLDKVSKLLVVGSLLVAALGTEAKTVDSFLDAGFNNPPISAKPQTWWHWMNGHVTREGITADLEAMRNIGIGGATIVIVDCGIPKGPVEFMTPEWRELFHFAVREANRVGIQLSVENCAGWSSSGGPWNTPTNAMQKIVCSELQIKGPVKMEQVLPQPPVNLGYYKDFAVLAFKETFKVPVSDSKPKGDGSGLVITSAEFHSKTSDKGCNVKEKIEKQIAAGAKTIAATTGQFGDPAYGEYKRLTLKFKLNGIPDVLTVEEHGTLIIPFDEFLLEKAHKAQKDSISDTYFQPTDSVKDPNLEPLVSSEVIELTKQMDETGKLVWEVPEGTWTILRLGHTPIGRNNHPAPAEGTGLEVDKMSKEALDYHWDGFMKLILEDVGPLAGNSLVASLIDSYEVGKQDWTPKFREEFIKRRGYDPIRFLPTFTHRIVDSPEITERFLWDMRKTIADLFAENYFAHFNTLCHKNGLNSAIEPYSGPFEAHSAGAPADVVMGEFWCGSTGHFSVKLASSIAHTYGKQIVAAESFTATESAGRWQNDPWANKVLGDLTYSQGLNRYIFHRYAMQPWLNRYPGMTMGPWGFHFERTETWWDPGKAWIDYLSRCEYLLQQGTAVSDVAYFNGESVPVDMRAGRPSTPIGYDYDVINTDVLLNSTSVKNGKIILKSGTSYEMLVLPPDDPNMTPEVLECLAKLVKKGATLVGMPPEKSPSLMGYPACDEKITKLVSEMWGNMDDNSVHSNAYGKGQVVWKTSLEEILTQKNVKPDFTYVGTSTNSSLVYNHRATMNTDIYFVSNQKRCFDTADCFFRVSGKVPELWHADTGVIEKAAVWSEEDGITKVHINFEPADSVFVVFRENSKNVDHLIAASGAQDVVAEAPEIKILNASYRAKDGAGSLDVTKLLSDLVATGNPISVKNEVLGEPANMHVKELFVEYTWNGNRHTMTVPENGMLVLTDGDSWGKLQAWNVEVEKNGSKVLKVTENGTYSLTDFNGEERKVKVTNIPEPQKVTGDWKVRFPENWGAPASIVLPELISWTDHEDKGVKYFSGTATYEKTITVPAEMMGSDRELWLDLGMVKNLAVVSLNGKELATLWKPPFRVNISEIARKGDNKLEVKVSNSWINRLIGDEQLPADCEWVGNQLKSIPQWVLDGEASPTGRYTFTTWHHWRSDSPLQRSGILGPVTLDNVLKIKE